MHGIYKVVRGYRGFTGFGGSRGYTGSFGAQDIDMNDHQVRNVTLHNYNEIIVDHGSVSGTVEIDIDGANVHVITLEDDTEFVFTMTQPPISTSTQISVFIQQSQTASNITWPQNIKWPSSELPDLSSDQQEYLLSFITLDGGTNWYGIVQGIEFGIIT